MKIRYPIAVLFLLCLAGSAWAQPGAVRGKFVDTDGETPLIGVNILLISQADTSRRLGEVTDLEGGFDFARVRPGAYVLQATYIGYQTLERSLTVASGPLDLGVLRLEVAASELETVLVEGVQTRSQQKGDTTEFNARAFRVNPDANAEDLISKMPGITSQGGSVQAQGESVRRVTIDGQEFFGNDASLALRSLPAEVIDKIQVFDRQSDQSQFTGFNDGNTEKTINIVTRGGGGANGQFGRMYAGYGTDDRYLAGGNVSYFQGKRRVSLVGLFNNINQQNFSNQDILGVVSTPSGGGGGGRGGGRWRGNSGPSASDFLVGASNGISTTNALGLNFSDTWAGKIKVAASYFYNQAQNNNLGVLSREYFLTETTSQRYEETNSSDSRNYNHRANIRLEYTIDSMNSIILTPRLNFQGNLGNSFLSGLNYEGLENMLINRTVNATDRESQGYSLNNSILYRHRFAKRGRTFSLNLGQDLSDNDGLSGLRSTSEFFGSTRPPQFIDQLTDSQTDGLTLNAFVSYTEPLGKNSQLQFNYLPSWTWNQTDRLTNSLDASDDTYSRLDTLLSNQLDNEVQTQRAGLRYRFNLDRKINLSFGGDYQTTRLSGDQVFPFALRINQTFQNILPLVFFNYSPTPTTSLRVFYRGSTNVPSVAQLQGVIDNSNPLLLTTGNPDLKQQFGHAMSLRYNRSAPAKGRTFFLLASLNSNRDYIGNASFIATADTLLQEGVLLARGAQLSRPVNLDGFWNAQTFVTYGMPAGFLKSNLNFNAGLTYRLTPGLINAARNEANTYNATGGIALTSNISPQLDFNLGYAGNYNIVRNTLQPQLDNNFYFHNVSFRFNWLPWKGLVITSDLNQTIYTGLGEDFNQNFTLWNAGLGYKFLKNQAAELRLTVFDILKQNNSINRNVTETYVEDSINQVLSQYFMVNFIYNLRNFGTAPPPAGNAPGMMPGRGMPH